MAKLPSLCAAMLVCAVLWPDLSHAQNSSHPLDVLRTEEYWTAYDVVQGSGRMDEDTHFISVLLHEPDKQADQDRPPGRPRPEHALPPP